MSSPEYGFQIFSAPVITILPIPILLYPSLEHNSMFIMDAGNVTFSPFNMYSSDATEKTDVINLAVSQAPPGAVRATVV